MVGAGNVHSLLWTFLRLRNTCKLASMNIHSDSYGDLTVTLRMVTAGQADQAPRRGGRQSSRQERGPGTQAPSPAAPPAPPTPAPATPAPAPLLECIQNYGYYKPLSRCTQTSICLFVYAWITLYRIFSMLY